MKVTVIGTGYVGTVTGACLAYLGHQVSCVDLDQTKISRLQKGDIPIYEPFLAELLPLAAQQGGIEFTTDLARAVAPSDVIFIAVGTPSKPSGEADLVYLESAARSVGAALDGDRFHVVVNKSTVPVGCGNLVETLVREGLQEARGTTEGYKFGVASNPEFLREGSAIADSLFADRIVIGTDDPKTLEILRDLYRPLVEQTFTPPAFLHRPSRLTRTPLVTTTITSAEMIKYAANSFLAIKIGFANEIANICERVGADITEVANGIGLDSRIGTAFLNAGIGWGGSCFNKDVRSLLHTAKEYGYQARLLEASLEVNQAQRMLVIQKLQEKLYIIKGRTIGLLGLAFKPQTDDLRDAPSLQIAERLFPIVKRNSPTVVNIAFSGSDESGHYDPATAPMFWDMRVKSLEKQALEPLKAHEEMRGTTYPEDEALASVVAKLQANAEYRSLFAGAFGSEQPVSAENLGRAIAAFERTLLANNSPFDRYMRGDRSAMTEEQVSGMRRFESVGCVKCHNGPMFSDYKLHVMGVPDNPALPASDDGAEKTYAFRTASLRNLTFTAPYEHNGMFRTLSNVVGFYEDARGGRSRNPNVSSEKLDPLIRELGDFDEEDVDLVEFLRALSDDSFDRTIPERVPSGLPVGGKIQ